MEEPTFSLDHFEQLVYTQQHVKASIQFIAALALLQQKRGKLDGSFLASGIADLPPEEQRQRFCTRLASAASTLFADPAFRLPPECFRLLLTLHEWAGLVFSCTAFGNADHVARNLNPRGQDNAQFLPGDSFVEKLCVLYSTESELELDFAALWAYNKSLAACLALVLLAPVFKGSASAHIKREALMEWLPGKLQQIADLDDLPTALLHNAYMFCSYADTPRRHEIKRDINALVRRKLDQLGLTDLPASQPSRAKSRKQRGKKPLMLVVLEWFGGAHSIYRTHSRTLEAAREHFEVVAFSFGYAIDDIGRAVFDRFIELEEPEYLGECLKTIRDFAEAERPDVLYMPSVGMFALTVFMSNLRVAPLQIAGLGHPATTHSDKIDYVSVEEDYVGDPACFSERLLKLPKDGQPYRPSVALPDIVAEVPPSRETLEVVITASAMKLNPGFLEACREIGARAATPVEFHFMSGVPYGLPLDRMREVIRQALPRAVVHGFHDYADYLARVNRSDLFLSPFPFGNTNGIVDALTLGLPGVCKRGPEVFERIDGALFERVGMPSWTTAESVEDYIAAAVRMIDAHGERMALRLRLIDTQAVERCFEGRPQAFGESVLRLVRDKQRQREEAVV
ncbi:o-linked N-acetylglucosamine transferase, spindly family, protein [Paraburkholderia xenovorans LB400]|uniref:Accessory processing protein n=1 Tax=Paraburkholderia xenovorans (strain LB400) TaxID=266265 RepID=Q13WM5_PARXL|nr:glycosyl transferase family 1 [Paraburkholderia xenovorans]ABE31514.1 Putative accessory processing protein [Paraburkholderia xenovorans LB400]AIP30492.1 o-linked N-acetylglucosamine transferase, spindly family, protein [Paraburkholderia xenovorans LB400]